MAEGPHHFYRLTSKGQALRSRPESASLPSLSIRILGLVEAYGYRTVIRSELARYPDRMVDGWLTELEANQLIESISAKPPPSLAEIARKTPALTLDDEERRLFAGDASFADISLSHLGVYIAQERVAHRAPSGKAPQDTVALVVEDDPDQLELAVLRLTNAGYPVETANCVKALYDRLDKRRTPDVIFLDVMLPDGDGFEVLSALRRHPTYALLPVIMVTAKTSAEDIAKGLALGADGYITKPYGRNTLDYVLRYVMQQEYVDAGIADTRARRNGSQS